MNLRWLRRTGLAPVALAATVLFPHPAAAETPTFARDVAPVFFKYCVQCHQPDGAAPFSLVTYAAARRHATQIAVAMAGRNMPPWQAAPEAGEFVGQPRPTPAEIDTVSRWVAAGAPEGRPGDAPRPPPLAGRWQLGPPDLVVTPATAFMLPAGGSDVFRILVLPIPGEQLRRVRALEFSPGSAVVHHANIRIDRTSASRGLDAQDPQPGYDGLLARSALFPDGHFLGWTPGQVAPFLPKGMAWPLAPGSDLVIQLHMQPSGKTERVLPAIGLYFTDEPIERTPVMVRLGRQDIDIPAGASSYVVSDAYTLPVDVELLAVQPHAHYRARTIRGVARLPDGTSRWLMLITRWNFRWQHLYRLRTPLPLPRGTVVSMEYVYDNSDDNPQNPQRPASRALWGQRSNEEMGDLWLQFLTASEADRLRLNQDFRPKAVSEDLVGHESLLQRNPGDAGMHDDAAVLSLEAGRVPAAVRHFRASAALRPQSAAAQFNLGTALALENSLDEAVAAFTRALVIDPQSAHAQHQLALTLRRLGRRDEALAALRALVRSTPDSIPGLLDLAWMLATDRNLAGGSDEAIAMAERAATLTQRQDPVALDTLGVAYASTGQFDRAIAAAEMALALGANGPLADEVRARLAGYRAQRPYQR